MIRNRLFELKHDGFRALAYLEDGRCRLVSRHRNVYKSFETLRDALSTLKAKSGILDGEIVCLDSDPFDLVLKSSHVLDPRLDRHKSRALPLEISEFTPLRPTSRCKACRQSKI